MSTDPLESNPPVPADPPPAAPPNPEPGPQILPKPPIQVGRTSGPLAQRLRPAAGPPGGQPAGQPPQAKKPRRDRDAEKYAGTESEKADEAERRDEVDEEASFSRGGGKGKLVQVPSKRGPLPSDLEAELAAALGDLSFSDVLKADAGSRTGSLLENDSRFMAPVVRIHGDDVFFTLDGRNEGVASLRAFKEPPALGTQLEVIVSGYDAENGLYNVSVPGAAISVSDWSDLQEGSVVEAKITAANTGGLECQVNNIRGFIPASQISMYRVENLAQFVGEKMLCAVTEANPQRRNLVLSRRAIMEREKEAARAETLAGLNVGDVREGIVRSLRDFGAFVDLGGVDGMIHISKMSWDRIKHPSEVLAEGQKVKVKVDSIDPDTGKIGLSYRDSAEHPWNDIEARFPPGSTAKGTVTRIANYGAFVKLAPGVEGLLHISELAHHRVVRVQNHVNEGDEVEVKVLEVDKPTQRISLSLKALMQAPEPKEGKKPNEPEVEETRREPAVRPKRANLRGGNDKSSGGEQFGLKW